MRWTDCHVHVLGGGLEALEALTESQRAYGYERSNFLSVEGMGDCAQNALAIAFKLLSPDHYAFGSLHYRFDYPFAEEVQTLWDLGLDGIKMIENKPTERKALGYRQDDPRYDGFYSKLQELDIPVLAQLNSLAGGAIGLAGSLLTVALLCAGVVHFGGAGDLVTLAVLERSAIGGFFYRLFI